MLWINKEAMPDLHWKLWLKSFYNICQLKKTDLASVQSNLPLRVSDLHINNFLCQTSDEKYDLVMKVRTNGFSLTNSSIYRYKLSKLIYVQLYGFTNKSECSWNMTLYIKWEIKIKKTEIIFLVRKSNSESSSIWC